MKSVTGRIAKGFLKTGAGKLRHWRQRRSLALLWIALLLADCSTVDRPVRYEKTYLDGKDCLFELAANGIQAQSWNAPQSNQCPVSTPVSVVDAGPRFEPRLNTSCALLNQWFSFRDTVDRLARRHLGSPIKNVHHLGSYNCRRMTGNAGRMSLHASARAIDFYAFDTENGKRVSIQKHYKNKDAKGRFLRAFANAACDHFGVVLTPAHDRAHHNHIHVDIGPWKVCRT